MSAINPASFVTPVTGLQLPSGLGPGAFNTDTDQYSSRLQKPEIGTHVFSAPNFAPTTLDRLWNSNQSANISPVPFTHVYSQPFQPTDLDNHQLDHLPPDYHPRGLQTSGTQPRYPSTPYHLQDISGPQYASQTDPGSGVARKTQALGTDWNRAFQGLSLGS